MPPRRHRHKKNFRYYFKKIFPFLFRQKKFKGTPVEVASPDTKFLTLKEVKEAQAAAMAQGELNSSRENTQFFESSGQQQRPALPPHVQRSKRRSRSWFRRLLDRLSFSRFKRRRRARNKENFEILSFEDIKRAKERLDSTIEVAPGEPGISISTPHISGGNIHHRRRKKRNRLFRFFSRSVKKKEAPVILPGINDVLNDDKPRKRFGVYVKPVLISTAAFMIAYQIVWLFYQFAVMVVASFNDIDSVLYYYEVMFPIGNTSPKWTQTNIIFITLSGPLFSLIMWAIYRHVILRRPRIGAAWRMFFIWLTLGSMMMFFGAFVAGAITRQGFGYVVNWLYMSIAFRIFFSMIFLSFIIWLSWNIVSLLPESSGSDSWKNSKNYYIFSRLIIPWLIGGSIMILLKITDIVPQHDNVFDYDLIILCSFLFAVVPPLFNKKAKPHYHNNRKTYARFHRSTAIKWVLVAVLFVSLIRFGILDGIHFLLKIGLDLGWYH